MTSALNTGSTAWYIRGDGNKPLGPFAAEQVIESWHTRRLDPNTLCWQEGMVHWLPLAVVEPFASAMRAERRSARLRLLHRVAVGLPIIVVLAAVAAIVGYFWWTESAMVARAQQLVAAEHFEEASALLEPLAKRCYFFRRRAGYLLALGLARQFASASKAEDATGDLLADAKKQFEELFAASPKWREQAKSDLAGIIGAVPSDVPGCLGRSVQLDDFLSAMQLADRKQLANELLSKAKGIWANSHGPEQADGEAVAWIVDTDAAAVDDVLAAIVSDAPGVEANLDQRMACIQYWVRGWPALAPLFGSGLAKRADKLAATGRLEKRYRMIATSKRIDSRFDTWGYWETYFQKADGKNPRDALEILSYMVEGEQNVERLKNATERYNDLRKRHPDVEMTPPSGIRDAADTARLHELIAEAEQSAKNGKYQDARTKLDDARRRFSSLWRRDADADRLDKDVRFHLDCEIALQSFGNGDLAVALTNVTDAPSDSSRGQGNRSFARQDSDRGG